MMQLLITRDCPVHRGCSEWIFRYLKDCVCNVKDGVSFGLGLLSVLSWGIAEVPQIITNHREKSTEGVSLLFLMTWVIGDLFNIVGCLLEPATLPTQFYMALLYTLTTLVLVAQTIYYTRLSKRRARLADQPSEVEEPLLPEKQPRPAESIKPLQAPVTSQPISSISVPSPSPRQFYYTSARSLTKSHTPTAGSYLSSSGNVRRGSYLASQPSLSSLQSPPETTPSHHHAKSEASIVRAVASGVLLFGGFALHSHYLPSSRTSSSSGFVFSGGRRLLQEEEHSRLGELFGWGMAAIYMGGRLPQIWLNITRGTVEGLNPMMFFCALTGNATYVGSILVRSTDWKKLKPNMPWLVDAAVCVVLDFFILTQFLYYRLIKKGSSSSNNRSNLEGGLLNGK